MTRDDLILAVLSAASGRPLTPVQLQKAAFLATRNIAGLVDEGPSFNFEAYDYGPFDRAVYVSAEQLEGEGLAEITRLQSSNWKTYTASPGGLAHGRTVLARMKSEQSGYLETAVDWVLKLSFADLVKSIYEAYPEMRANSIFRG